jgi:hypothetical protein
MKRRRKRLAVPVIVSAEGHAIGRRGGRGTKAEGRAIAEAVGVASGRGTAEAKGSTIAAAAGKARPVLTKKTRGRPSGTKARAKIDDSAALPLRGATKESVIRRLAGRCK